MKYHLRLHDNFYTVSELVELWNTTKTYGLPGQQTLDGPVDETNIPNNIRKIVQQLPRFVSAGFVKVEGSYNLPPHEDSFLSDKLDPYRNLLGDFYIDWLRNTGNRKCSLMIPVIGDFKNTHTDLYTKYNKKHVESFTLEQGPVLFPTSGKILHGVDNTQHSQRVTFQISYGESYEYIRDKILTLGLAQV